MARVAAPGLLVASPCRPAVTGALEEVSLCMRTHEQLLSFKCARSSAPYLLQAGVVLRSAFSLGARAACCAQCVGMARSIQMFSDRADRAWARLPSQSVQLPWEVSFQSCLELPLSLNFERPTRVRVPERSVVPVETKKPRVDGSSVLSVAVKVSAKPWHEDDRRGAALFQLQAIVEGWPDAFGIVALCRADANGTLDLDELSYSIASACAHKATGTIVRRLSSLNHFVTWADSVQASPFPVTERVSWMYLTHLDRSEAPWSKPGGFTQCVNWCRGVLGLKVEDYMTSSPRVVGLCKGFEAKAPPPRRAPALAVEEVKFLEGAAAFADNAPDCVIAGALLFMMFSCARASDAARMVTLEVDFSDPDESTVWIEGSVSKSKTAMGARARLLLPLLAPCVYLETPWIPQWLEARVSLGLSVKGAIDKGSLIPHFGEDGVPTGNAMSSQQITKWLRGILAEVSPDSSRLSSHSLKATGLTWAASAGVALDTRRLLAHHVHDSARSTETYSRDVLAPAARIFEEVLLAIRDGDFVPDNPRGSQIRTRQRVLAFNKPDPVVPEGALRRSSNVPPDLDNEVSAAASAEQPAPAPEHMTDTTDSESDRLSEEDMPTDPPLPGNRARREAVAALPPWCQSFMHAVSGCLHVQGVEMRNRLLCGRTLSDRYVTSDVVELEEGRPHCKQCWTHSSLQD